MKPKKAFTLIEILIALVLAGILFALIFRTYVHITQISARMENEKKLNAEIAFVTETVQNIADIYQIDYAHYGATLKDTHGRTKELYLTGNGASWTILQFSGDNLYRIQNKQITPLISTGYALITNWSFKLIPFTRLPTDKFLDIQHPGFRLLTSLQTANYNSWDRVRDVQANVQQFYNLQRVE